MAKGRSGQAGAFTNGDEAYIIMRGDGKAGVDGGMAWAMAGNENMAVAYCDSAQNRNRALPGSRSATQARICNCSNSRASCASGDCKCPCHFL